MMKCKHCNGKGRILEPFGNRTIPAGCPVCGGTGEIKEASLTNDGWRRTCSAEEFADWIVDVLFSEDFKKHIYDKGYISMHSYKTEVLAWLKEKHSE